MSRKLDKKNKEALEFKRQLQKKQREEKATEIMRRKGTGKGSKVEKARLDALKNLLEPTRDELREAAGDIHVYQSIVKLMFPKAEHGADVHIRTFIHKQTARPLLFHIAHSKIVHTLDLSNMFLRDDVGLYIADCVKQNASIKVLCLNNNLFTDTTAKHLGEALKINCTIQCLSLEANKRITTKTLEWRKKCKRYRSSRRFGYFYVSKFVVLQQIHAYNEYDALQLRSYSWQIIRVLPNQQQNNDLVGHQSGKSDIEFVDLESMRKVIERNYKDVLKRKRLKERYDMQEPERHKRYLEIVKEKKADEMKREVDTRINKMVKEEEEKIRLDPSTGTKQKRIANAKGTDA